MTFLEFVQTVDFSPLFISLKTGVTATGISFFAGVSAAGLMMRARPKTKAVVDAVLTLPLVLPPTVMGFLLLLLFSLKRPVGAFLYVNFDIKIVQSWLGCIVAASVIAFPLMYRGARGAFEQVDVNLIYAGRTVGMSETMIFLKVILPAAAPGVANGTILAFARSIGEYGATSMLAGNILGKTSTIAQTIAMVIQDGNYQKAGFWVVTILLISLLLIVIMNCITGRSRAGHGGWN